MLKHFLGFFACLYCLLLPARAFASSYDVSAQVQAPLPQTLPVVTGPAYQQLQTGGVYINGTCAVVVPTLIIVIIRDNQTIGSGSCSAAGTFSIFVSLVLGANVIYPQYLTITGQVGSLGSPVTLFYESKANKENGTTKPADAATDLGLLLDYDFITYDNEVITELLYTISGGKPPYSVVVSWGDEAQKKYQVSAAGQQAVKHQYKSILPQSQLTIQVTDQLGAKVSQSRALISFRKGVYVPPAQPAEVNKYLLSPVVVAGIVVVGASIFGGILLLTRPLQATQAATKIAKKNKTSIKRKKR